MTEVPPPLPQGYAGTALPPARQRFPRWFLWLMAAGAGAVLCILFVFNPAEGGPYPTCTFHRLTGLLCPGCGGLRAAHALLHGRVQEAFRLNAVLVGTLPLLLIYGGWFMSARWRGRPAPGLSLRLVGVWAVVVIVYAVARNL